MSRFAHAKKAKPRNSLSFIPPAYSSPVFGIRLFVIFIYSNSCDYTFSEHQLSSRSPCCKSFLQMTYLETALDSGKTRGTKKGGYSIRKCSQVRTRCLKRILEKWSRSGRLAGFDEICNKYSKRCISCNELLNKVFMRYR